MPNSITQTKSKILLVEDSGFFRRALASNLIVEGFDVVTATNGEEAIRLAQTEGPNLILMDLHMPRMDGMMALRVLRSHPLTKTIPVIVLSANDQREDKATVIGLGAAAYCDKSALKFDRLLWTINASMPDRAFSQMRAN